MINYRKEYWKKLYIDYEYTINNQIEYMIGVLYNNNKTKKQTYIWFKNTHAFFTWLGKQPWKKVKIYAHYGLKADFKFIVKYLKIIEMGEGSKFITCHFKDKKIKLIDTISLIAKPLSQIGEELGLIKENQDILYSNIEDVDYNSERFQKLIKYNKRDCEIISKLPLFFKRVNLLKKIKVKDTIASTSFKFLFDTKKIYRFTSPDFDDAYRGGFCELFKLHGNNIKCYDINSLYPSVMSEWIANPYQKPTKVYERNPNNAGIYLTNIFDYDLQLSFIRKLHNFRNMYINPSEFRTWLSTSEIDYLEKHNIKFKIEYGWEVDKYYGMKDIIQNLYKLREKPEYKTPIKLCLNSSYGKFGERDYSNEVIKILDCAENLDYLNKILLEKKYTEAKYIAGVHYIFIKKDNITNHRNILTASNITGSARVKLFNYFDKVGHNNIFYSDTDSIHTSSNLLDDECSNALGKLKIEYNIKEALYLGRKAYLINLEKNNIEKIKGVSRKKPVIENEEMFKKIKHDYLTNFKTTLDCDYNSLTTILEYLKTLKHEKKVEKKLTFNPNNYRNFVSINQSNLYNHFDLEDTKIKQLELKNKKEYENELTELTKSDYFDTVAYKTTDKSLNNSLEDLINQYKYE